MTAAITQKLKRGSLGEIVQMSAIFSEVLIVGVRAVGPAEPMFVKRQVNEQPSEMRPYFS